MPLIVYILIIIENGILKINSTIKHCTFVINTAYKEGIEILLLIISDHYTKINWNYIRPFYPTMNLIISHNYGLIYFVLLMYDNLHYYWIIVSWLWIDDALWPIISYKQHWSFVLLYLFYWWWTFIKPSNNNTLNNNKVLSWVILKSFTPPIRPWMIISFLWRRRNRSAQLLKIMMTSSSI